MKTREQVQAELGAAKKRADEDLAAIFEAESRDPGEGFEFCTRDEYRDDPTCQCRYLLHGRLWAAWDRYAFTAYDDSYQYRRPIPADRAWDRLAQILTGREDLSGAELRAVLEAQWHLRRPTRVEVHEADPPCAGCAEPEPRWVACTAAEAAAHPDASAWWNVDEWIPCHRSDVFDRAFAYRTTATLDNWVAVPVDVYERAQKINRSIYREGSGYGSRVVYRVLRATIPLGTVLG